MQAEVINTGSELLLGLVTNTHLGYLAGELSPCGVTIARQVCVPDGPPIREALAGESRGIRRVRGQRLTDLAPNYSDAQWVSR